METQSDQLKAGNASKAAQTEVRRRDPDRTRRAILSAARVEFCQHGFNGARIERIARRSKSNTRMIYHYFGNKEGVYTSILESVYSEIRNQELQLDLENSSPLEGIRKLILFSFDFFATHSDFIALINTENILKGRFLKRLPSIQAMSVPLIDVIRDILQRGEKDGVFRPGIDPLQFYVSIVAQSQLHISNRYTLSVLFNEDLTDADWLQARREHTAEMLISFLSKPA